MATSRAAGAVSGRAGGDRAGLAWPTVRRLLLLVALERKILGLVVAYAVAIGVFSLVVPLTVSELVNAFAFAIQPVMIVTLAAILVTTLVFIGSLQVLQTRSLEILSQRTYTRIALALARALPTFREERFAPRAVNYFFEAEQITRAFAAMLVDVVNIAVGGTIGMTLLVVYHPYFLIYDVVLLLGFVLLTPTLSFGGFRITLTINELHHALLRWFQSIADNLLDVKAAAGASMLADKTDHLVFEYIRARKRRSDILHRQYKGSMVWQAVCHGGLIAMAAWLMMLQQITLGQFVAAEVIVGRLLFNFDVLARRMYAVFILFTSFNDLAGLFSLPRDQDAAASPIALSCLDASGLSLSCRGVSLGAPGEKPLVTDLTLEVSSGERVVLQTTDARVKSELLRVLSGLHLPASGVIRYDDVDLRQISRDSLIMVRGLIHDSHRMLVDGSVEDNIVFGRGPIPYEDVQWALRFAEASEQVDRLPRGLSTHVEFQGKGFTTSQVTKLLIARAVVTRPRLLIVDGGLYGMAEHLRVPLLRRLCSKEGPWTVVIVSIDLAAVPGADRCVRVESAGARPRGLDLGGASC